MPDFFANWRCTHRQSRSRKATGIARQRLVTESKYFPVVWGPKNHNSNWLLKHWKHWKRSKQTQQLEMRQPHTPDCFCPLFHERLHSHQQFETWIVTARIDSTQSTQQQSVCLLPWPWQTVSTDRVMFVTQFQTENPTFCSKYTIASSKCGAKASHT